MSDKEKLEIATTALERIRVLMLQGWGDFWRYDQSFRILNDALKEVKND